MLLKLSRYYTEILSHSYQSVTDHESNVLPFFFAAVVSNLSDFKDWYVVLDQDPFRKWVLL